MTKAVVYAYGTLRPGIFPTVEIKGAMFDLGWFPGVKLGGQQSIICERIEVNDLAAVDRYEGYSDEDPANSLYIRRPILDGYIYEYNREVNPLKKVGSGDWLDYTKEKRGKNAGHF